ncbi:DUF1592 domain-containing protein [Hyalangium versicolor]|uniref:DUF1592 domain-containing protein n=1 Tax=Hyalangium versicolor TaxID=2861190 RepID=UPI001CCB4E71|nr:DUF1592 domain-containing protein [Hyalangium versicolor]
MRRTRAVSLGRWSTWGLLAVVLAGCQGTNSQPPAEEDDGGRDGSGSLPAHLLRRLNRTEYANTVRELLGPGATTAQVLPADDQVDGYDNNAQVLGISPLLLEKYALAAEDLVTSALAPTNADGRARLLTCDFSGANETPCAKQILSQFGRKAWRRPLSADEVSRLFTQVQQSRSAGDTFEVALGVGLQAILASPHFLFRVEVDPALSLRKTHPLNSFELATRMSYLLWSGPPDEALLAVAENDSLQDDAELERQTRRMLADARAKALVDNFASQWLRTRQLAQAQPSSALFPTYESRQLGPAMATETALVFSELLQGDRSILDLVDADFTYVNAALASHYGLTGTFDASQFTRVTLSPESHRRGILTHGSILAMNATPTRNSTVKRGKWVLGRLLCQEPPPPPANIPQLPTGPTATGSLRSRMEQHVSDPMCSGCHGSMDPIGFALEHYDAIGAWRATDGSYAIDARGTLPDGRSFDGALELASTVKQDPALPACVVRQVFTYALGRQPEYADESTLKDLTQSFQERGYRMRELLVKLVLSPQFRMRTAQQEAQP